MPTALSKKTLYIDDPPAVKLKRIVQAMGLRKLYHQDEKWSKHLYSEFEREHAIPRGKLDAESAHSVLNEWRLFLEQRLLALTSGYPPQQWIWYSRRLAYVFLELSWASRNKLFAFDLLEVAGRYSKQFAGPDVSDAGHFTFAINDCTVRRLLRALTTAVRLSDTMYHLRLSARGCSFHRTDSGQLVPDQPPELRQALDLDGKRRTVAMFFAGLGSVPQSFHRSSSMIEDGHSYAPFISDVAEILPFERPPESFEDLGAFTGVKTVRSSMRFAPNAVSLDSLAELYSAWWRRSDVLSLLFLHTTIPLFSQHPEGWSSIVRYGYVTGHRGDLLQYIEQSFPAWRQSFLESFAAIPVPESFAELMDELALLQPRLDRRVFGNPVLTTNDNLMLDLYAPTLDVQTSLVYPKHEFSAEQRSTHFEKCVQDAIDCSTWRPGSQAREYLGQILRLGGNDLTDVDAIGQRDGRLLLPSCKSVILDVDYFLDDWKSVSTYIDRMVEAVRRWLRVVQTLNDYPVGDNYDFSCYDGIVAPVCTPSLVYVPIGQCTEFIADDLRAVVPFGELFKWLNRESS